MPEQQLTHKDCNCQNGPCGWVHHEWTDCPEENAQPCDCTLSFPKIVLPETR
jgi:hypothetical protein